MAKPVTALHLGIMGTTEEKVYSKAKEKEHLLVRARRGAQKPVFLPQPVLAWECEDCGD